MEPERNAKRILPASFSALRFADCQVDPVTRQLCKADQQVHLPRLPFDLLMHLIERRPALVRREELLEVHWSNRPGGDEALTRCVSSLRKALGDLDEPPKCIETRRGEGYRFIADVHPVAVATAEPKPFVPNPETARPALPRTQAPGRKFAYLVAAAAASATLYLVGMTLWVKNEVRQAAPFAVRARPKILWVDDHPERNAREIAALIQAGVVVDLAKSNSEAAEELRGREYDLLVSDIGRDDPQRPSGGLDLVKDLKVDRNRVPPLVYYVAVSTGPRTPDGYPVTTRASELFGEVSSVLRWKLARDITIEAPHT
jgi:DNA-binding response OmpR family regulator